MLTLHEVLTSPLKNNFHLDEVKNFYKYPDKNKRLCYYNCSASGLVSVVALWGNLKEIKDFFNNDGDMLLCVVNSNKHIEYIKREAVEI